mmetsp:Transcript_44519/g.123240  ORF Transcript_44519/g.123240 Transcript_44519/m.123240 type:complete len:539 (-) Transcript_44519:185-1801(-)
MSVDARRRAMPKDAYDMFHSQAEARRTTPSMRTALAIQQMARDLGTKVPGSVGTTPTVTPSSFSELSTNSFEGAFFPSAARSQFSNFSLDGELPLMDSLDPQWPRGGASMADGKLEGAAAADGFYPGEASTAPLGWLGMSDARRSWEPRFAERAYDWPGTRPARALFEQPQTPQKVADLNGDGETPPKCVDPLWGPPWRDGPGRSPATPLLGQHSGVYGPRVAQTKHRKESAGRHGVAQSSARSAVGTPTSQCREALRNPGSRPSSGRSAGSEAKMPLPPRHFTSVPPPVFSVSSPRLGASAAGKSFEDLQPSLRNALEFIRSLPCLPRTPWASERPFLPPHRLEAPLRTLVLDLDETLVHCSRSGSDACKGAPDLVVEFEDGPSIGSVGFRPYVNFFLEVAAESFEIAVFTASQQKYADKVIDALDPWGRYITHRLYRQHCTEAHGAFFKELGLLGRPLSQCILVDNSPISVACNADNGIIIKSWYGDRNDKELIDLLGILQDVQVVGGDVSKYLQARYGLTEFFEALRDGTRFRLR